jgi:hypothetical protein
MTTVDMQTYLRTLLEDIATSPAIDTSVRRGLLADVLAPLGPTAADRQARQIEAHAYWLRVGTHQSGHDVAFAASVEEAAYLVGRTLDHDTVSEALAAGTHHNHHDGGRAPQQPAAVTCTGVTR